MGEQNLKLPSNFLNLFKKLYSYSYFEILNFFRDIFKHTPKIY